MNRQIRTFLFITAPFVALLIILMPCIIPLLFSCKFVEIVPMAQWAVLGLMARAAYLPQLALMGGAIFTNPSVYNGFERKFKGSFNVGVAVRVPVLDWGENMYKIRAAKCATNLAQLTYDEAHDMIELQVAQSNFKVREANKKLITAKKNIQSAEENLRCANIGFKEGVMNTTDVMSAQTAWLKARTQKIDAEIDVKLSEIAQQKALGRN